MNGHFSHTVSRKKPFLLGILIALLATALFALFFAIPQAARLTLPYRWGSIPLGQPRFALVQYLGRANLTDSMQLATQGEQRIAYRRNGEYVLTTYYNTKDTTLNGYTIYFTYRLGFFHWRYQLKNVRMP